LKCDPKQVGLVPYGVEVKQESLDLQADEHTLARVLRTKQFWLCTVISFSGLFLRNVIVVHIAIHAADLGIPTTAGATILSVAAGVSTGGRIVIGGIRDKIGYKSALLIVNLTGLAVFPLLLVARELWMLYLFAVIFGSSLWTTSAIMGPLMAELFGLESHGVIFGVTEFASMNPSDRVLDVCCGTGAQVLEYGRRGIIATGIDISPAMLRMVERNRMKRKLNNVSFQLADAANLPFLDSHFDYATISSGLHDKGKVVRDRVISEMKRVVKQHGTFVFMDFRVPLPQNVWA